MIDLHTHIMFGVDDGARNIEDSILLIRRLESLGYKKIVLSPHYIDGDTYRARNSLKEIRIENIRRKVTEENIDVELYLGNEVKISPNINPDIVKEIKDGNIETINNSRYVLVEFSMYKELSNAKDILFDLINHGYIPVLAHPERYVYYKDDNRYLSFYKELISRGVLLQGNLKSLKGAYGNSAKIMLEEMLKRNMIHFICTDTHRDDLDYFKSAKEDLIHLVGHDMMNDLLSNNADLIIDNKEVIPYEIIEPKKEGFLRKLNIFI